MDNKMRLDEKIIEEINRYKKINNYISEQDLGAPLPAGDIPAPSELPPPPGGDAAATPPAPQPTTPQKIDAETDPDVEKIDKNGDSEENNGDNTEELDITDLVTSQKNIEKKQEDYFDNLFSQLSKLESKLSEMDSIMGKLNTLETKIEKYREKTPEEKLELRSLDSYPYSQKLSQFFDDKKEDMAKSGKNEYVLTDNDVTDLNTNDIKNSFQP
jgi:hypothetical protein